MKFFRMDSDLPDWPAWKTVRKVVGARNYQNARLVYIDMYAYIAQQYSSEKRDSFEVVIDCLVESTRLKRQTVVSLLLALGHVYGFQTTFVDHTNATCTPADAHAAFITYPNFLIKQEKYKKKSERIIQEQDKNKNQNNRGNKTGTEPPADLIDENLIDQTWDAYKNAFAKTYGVHPIKNSTQIANIEKLITRVGDNAPDVVRTFLSFEKKYYLDRKHSLEVCVNDAEPLYTVTMQIQSQKANQGPGEMQNLYEGEG